MTWLDSPNLNAACLIGLLVALATLSALLLGVARQLKILEVEARKKAEGIR